MKKLVAVSLVFLSAAVLADATNVADVAAARTARAERRKARGSYVDRILGGYVSKPNSAKGKVVILNAQNAVPRKDFEAALAEIRKSVHPEMAVADVATVKLANPKDDIAKAGGKVGVVLADSPDLPMLVTAPEAGWSIVNVAALKDGKADGLAHRVRVELLRGFALASGCAFMSRDPIVLRSNVLISEDLDLLDVEEYGVMARLQMQKELPTHGVTPWTTMPYRKACEEGWAHQPTNDFQKAIWKRVHQLPSKPMKIQFDPAAQKGKVTK